MNITMKAKFIGSCQLCGRVQKLPSDKLSLHGYTVAWGFFSGTCPGSKGLPFEVSTNLIEAAIASAKDEIKRLAKQSEDLKAGVMLEGTKAWNHSYTSPTYSNKGGYHWEQIEVIGEVEMMELSSGPYAIVRAHYVDRAGTKHNIQVPTGCGIKTVDALRKNLNVRYAGAIDDRIKQLKSYVAWQKDRIKDWKPAELKPVVE